MSRLDGFYWLKMSWGEWIIKRWKENGWDFPFLEYDHSVSCIVEIDERQIVRTESKIYPECPDAHCQYTGECQASFTMREKCKMDPPSTDFLESQERRKKYDEKIKFGLFGNPTDHDEHYD